VPAGLADLPRANEAPMRAARPISRPLSRQGALLQNLNPQARTPPRPFELGHADIDPRLVATWKRLASRALSGRSRLNWGYGDPQGEPRCGRRSPITWRPRGGCAAGRSRSC